MAQSQEELQRRMASLVAELRGVMDQMGGENTVPSSGPSDAIAAAAAATVEPRATAAPSATSSDGATPPPASSAATETVVPAEVDPVAAFSSPFSVTSGPPSTSAAVNATLEQDIAKLFAGGSSSASTVAESSSSQPSSSSNPHHSAGGNATSSSTSDMERWMHQMMSTMQQNGQSISQSDAMAMMQQYMYAQQQGMYHSGGGRGYNARSYQSRGGYGRGGRYGSYGGGGRGAFPPAGAHFMGGGYDGYYQDDGSQEMINTVYALFDQFNRLPQQRQGPPQPGSQQQQTPGQQQPAQQQGHPQQQQGNVGSNTAVNRNNGAVQQAPPQQTAGKSQPASGSSFRPNLSAKPFRPPGIPTVYGAAITANNNTMMQDAFSSYKELKIGAKKDENADDDDIHYATGANAPRKRKARKLAAAAAVAGGAQAAANAEDEDDSNTPMGYVEFKRQKIKKFPCVGVVQPGQYVMVDGDRGLDCGLLVQMTAPGKDGMLHVMALEGFTLEESKMKPERGRIIRVAETQEVDKLHNDICTAEKTALFACRKRCNELNLKIDILDCEYQFDMKKVSFYFNSDKSVDFRDLVRDLYRSFGARIWMENINPNVKNVVPHGSRHH
ncbi:Hypothetical protein, putative [Bodo saltans]|uniref:PSP1 C-terminal domain-containing protein n=1 Tax=Bodo saltans TaxID=75058 RepID=A0A0S4JR93_BODSA|nr:Hypothetical protein, putative [Bodo saltans]|eukprot:CUG92854.1 Hypothetical protein, putative [Bodo saltans]